MISIVTNQGKERWMIIDDVLNADQLIEFLEALIKDAVNKILLILDNLRVIIPSLSKPSSPSASIGSKSSICRVTRPS